MPYKVIINLPVQDRSEYLPFGTTVVRRRTSNLAAHEAIHMNKHRFTSNKKKIRAIDLFCGAGGSSWGARNAGVQIVAGFDKWSLAGQVFQDNFPEATFYPGRLERINLQDVARKLGKIDLILASPECTTHSLARGNRRRSWHSSHTAFQVVRFASELQPRWIVVENVLSMLQWPRYEEFLDGLRQLGYHLREQRLTASEFGVPQSRTRLFVLCDRKRMPDEIIPSPKVVKKFASGAVDLNGRYPFSALKSPQRAEATLERARVAIENVGTDQPFLLVYYGSDGAGGWQQLDVPLRTVTTLDRFALVKPGEDGHVMRMLQVPELKKAMGFPALFKIQHGVRREKIHLLGNAVCPPVMRAIVRSLTQEGTS